MINSSFTGITYKLISPKSVIIELMVSNVFCETTGSCSSYIRPECVIGPTQKGWRNPIYKPISSKILRIILNVYSKAKVYHFLIVLMNTPGFIPGRTNSAPVWGGKGLTPACTIRCGMSNHIAWWTIFPCDTSLNSQYLKKQKKCYYITPIGGWGWVGCSWEHSVRSCCYMIYF